jgi:hypothetical protein
MVGNTSGRRAAMETREIEVYKIFVETAERNIERRFRMNQFFLSLITALFVAFAYINKNAPDQLFRASNTHTFETLATCALSVLLMVISFFWFSVLLNFRALSVAKYKVILDMEKRLELPLFAQEWSHYKALRKSELTQIELMVPLACYFVGLFGALFWFWLYVRQTP